MDEVFLNKSRSLKLITKIQSNYQTLFITYKIRRDNLLKETDKGNFARNKSRKTGVTLLALRQEDSGLWSIVITDDTGFKIYYMKIFVFMAPKFILNLFVVFSQARK